MVETLVGLVLVGGVYAFILWTIYSVGAVLAQPHQRSTLVAVLLALATAPLLMSLHGVVVAVLDGVNVTTHLESTPATRQIALTLVVSEVFFFTGLCLLYAIPLAVGTWLIRRRRRA